jgi:hypothetical protein
LGQASLHIAHEDLVPHRHANHSERRPAALDERDIYGELAVLRQELPGAVERVDEPVGRPRGADAGIGQAAFLGDDRQLRSQASQAVQEDAVRRQVGLGER